MRDFQFIEIMEVLNKIEQHTGFIAKNTRLNEISVKEVITKMAAGFCQHNLAGHTYSKSMNQSYPRKCIHCGKPEPTANIISQLCNCGHTGFLSIYPDKNNGTQCTHCANKARGMERE